MIAPPLFPQSLSRLTYFVKVEFFTLKQKVAFEEINSYD